MTEYIEIPIETDPELLAQEAFDFLQARISGWVPNDANLETIMIEAMSLMTAEARDVASAVPTDVFRYYGELVGIEPQEATHAVSTVDFALIDNLGYTIPAGTQIGIRTSGDNLVPFQVTADTVIAPGSTTALDVPIQAVEPGVESSGLPDTSPVELIDILDFIDTITLNAETTGGIDAELTEDYLNRLRLRLRLLAPRPILANDFAIFAQDIAGVERAIALDMYEPNHNLLTANQSSAETDATGMENVSNTTLTRATVNPAHGVASWNMLSVGAGDMIIRNTLAAAMAVVPGDQVTALASIRPNLGRAVTVGIGFYTGADALIGSITYAGTVSPGAGVYANLSYTLVAPATAAKAVIFIKVVGTAGASELANADKLAMRRGNSIDWTIGGTSATQERTVTISIVDEAGEPLSVPIRNEVDAYIESAREVNFVLHIIDPSYTLIDVTFAAKANSGWDPMDVEVRAEAAVADYLSPGNWGLPSDTGDVPFAPQWINQTLVRYLELAQVLNSVPGLNYIETLTFRRGTDGFATTDVLLPGPIPMPRPGVITGTVTA